MDNDDNDNQNGCRLPFIRLLLGTFNHTYISFVFVSTTHGNPLTIILFTRRMHLTHGRRNSGLKPLKQETNKKHIWNV